MTNPSCKDHLTGNLYQLDKKRYLGKMPIYQKFYHVEIGTSTDIGAGLYIGHPYCVTINPKVKIGRNCNIHKGVTIGQENRGSREGCPTIGDFVWIGANATIVGKITIGDDVLIAPNTFVNQDVPSHSVVFGSPCIIKHKDEATLGCINYAMSKKKDLQ